MARTKTTAKRGNTFESGGVAKKEKEEKGGKKSYRFRPGTVALRHIRALQKQTKPVLGYQPVNRLIREIAQGYKADMRFEKDAIHLIRMALEEFVHVTMTDGMDVAVAAQKRTLQRRHFLTAHKVSKDLIRMEAYDISLRKSMKTSDGAQGAPKQLTAL
jgi:histone H3